jgi:hypothetical protein
MFARCRAGCECSLSRICPPAVSCGQQPTFKPRKLSCVSKIALQVGTPGVLRRSAAQHARLHARGVGATRCVALAPSCTMVPQNATPLRRVRRTLWATHRVAPTLRAGSEQDRLKHGRFPVV